MKVEFIFNDKKYFRARICLCNRYLNFCFKLYFERAIKRNIKEHFVVLWNITSDKLIRKRFHKRVVCLNLNYKIWLRIMTMNEIMCSLNKISYIYTWFSGWYRSLLQFCFRDFINILWLLRFYILLTLLYAWLKIAFKHRKTSKNQSVNIPRFLKECTHFRKKN